VAWWEFRAVKDGVSSNPDDLGVSEGHRLGITEGGMMVALWAGPVGGSGRRMLESDASWTSESLDSSTCRTPFTKGAGDLNWSGGGCIAAGLLTLQEHTLGHRTGFCRRKWS